MRKIAAVLVCLAAVPALAREPWRQGGSATSSAVAFRGGYGLPWGEVVKGLELGDIYKGSAPGWIEVGARGDRTFLGLYFQYAAAFVKDCPPGMSCSGYTMRAGVEILHSLLAPTARFSPWLGAGIGWEGLKLKAGGNSVSFSAFEFANLQLGGDVRVSRSFSVGPYATVSFARYLQAEGETIEDRDRANHAWLQMGLRCEARF
jgi:hypothetical protein